MSSLLGWCLLGFGIGLICLFSIFLISQTLKIQLSSNYCSNFRIIIFDFPEGIIGAKHPNFPNLGWSNFLWLFQGVRDSNPWVSRRTPVSLYRPIGEAFRHLSPSAQSGQFGHHRWYINCSQYTLATILCCLASHSPPPPPKRWNSFICWPSHPFIDHGEVPFFRCLLKLGPETFSCPFFDFFFTPKTQFSDEIIFLKLGAKIEKYLPFFIVQKSIHFLQFSPSKRQTKFHGKGRSKSQRTLLALYIWGKWRGSSDR